MAAVPLIKPLSQVATRFKLAYRVQLPSLAQSPDSRAIPLSMARISKCRTSCRKHINPTMAWYSKKSRRIGPADRNYLRRVSCGVSRRVGSGNSNQKFFIDDEFAVMERNILKETQLRQALMSLIASGLMLMMPSIQFADSRISAADNSAIAAPANQLRQAGVLVEKLAGGLKTSKVLDKITTVISGQTTVDPEIIDKELKAIADGEDDIGERLKYELLNNLQDTWSTFIDVTSNFNPSTFSESAGASAQGLLEGAAERFAAWELSTLVALGERWLILTPVVIIPMAWQMSRYRNKQERTLSERQEEAFQLSEEVNLRQLKVRRELERMELKASLLELIRPQNKNQLEADSKKKRINQIVQRLQELNPSADLAPTNLVSKGSTESSTYIQQRPDVDGNWLLSYVSQLSDEDGKSQFPDIPGLEINNVQQKIWHGSLNGASNTSDDQPISTKLLARNTAQISLGLLGVVEVAVQGNWEDMKDKQTALVSFDTFSIRPLNLFGTVIREDLPPLNIPVPRSLQQSTEWEIIYVDGELRINKGKENSLYIFRKID
ncbi:hypothetical protein O6H91_10G047000 [Diphasiastrum complanatum]|uniref:Uncharacterized protein n=1 Tax=Diphasiastrum complanatum TaxID=34168 RepID=A0ACC2CGQ5_DIPCM|nr:hypothetical protein O6H91_10G047000 [Diphasiastrum complanatum]